jgi:hypothetical protein
MESKIIILFFRKIKSYMFLSFILLAETDLKRTEEMFPNRSNTEMSFVIFSLI